jgi:hypothetical protein
MTAAILWTGLLAGVLDGLAAVGLYLIRGGRAPARVFNFIASGVFGPAALTGGTPMALAGVGFHLVIAIGWTTLFFLVARQWEALRRHTLAAAVGYGVFVWVMMSQVVLPLSRVQMAARTDPTQAAIAALVLIVCIGAPISIGARRFFSRPEAP